MKGLALFFLSCLFSSCSSLIPFGSFHVHSVRSTGICSCDLCLVAEAVTVGSCSLPSSTSTATLATLVTLMRSSQSIVYDSRSLGE